MFFGESFGNYKPGATEVSFARDDLQIAAGELGIELPKNLGDVVYSIRYRSPMPTKILATQPEGMEWVIEGVGRALYKFCLVYINRIRPNPDLIDDKNPRRDARDHFRLCAER